jgi:hypothetical protein
VWLTLESQLTPQFSGDRRYLKARQELRLGRIIVDCCDAVNCYLGILVVTTLVYLLSRSVLAGREDYCHAAERTLPIRIRQSEPILNRLIAP